MSKDDGGILEEDGVNAYKNLYQKARLFINEVTIDLLIYVKSLMQHT